jgi:hypothetical protein
VIRGGCLCGGIRFEIHGELRLASHCHCSMCRKAHGAAFGTYGIGRMADFRLLMGEELIARYASSPGVTRTFCKRCGSTLQFISEKAPGDLEIALGALDDDPGVRPTFHIYVASKAPWFEITDGLPQYPKSSKA